MREFSLTTPEGYRIRIGQIIERLHSTPAVEFTDA
jgi:hypothetical protein